MKNLIRTIVIMTALCLCAMLFTACENTNGESSQPEATSGESSNSAQTEEKLLLYKVNFIHPVMGYVTTYEYNEYGQVLKTNQAYTDGNTSSMLYEYDDAGLLVKETREQDGEIRDTRTLEYGENGLLLKETNTGSLANNTITYTYDENDRLSQVVTESDGASEKQYYSYNEDESYSVRVVLSNTDEVVRKYDRNGLLLSEVGSDASRVVYTYDDSGKPQKVEFFDEFGELTQNEEYTYNGLVTDKVSYTYGERESAKRFYYDEYNNLLKYVTLSEDGEETIREEREYKNYTVKTGA